MGITIPSGLFANLLEIVDHPSQMLLLDLLTNVPVADVPLDCLYPLAHGNDVRSNEDGTDEDVIIKTIDLMRRPDIAPLIDRDAIDFDLVEERIEEGSMELCKSMLLLLSFTGETVQDTLLTQLEQELSKYMTQANYGQAILACYKALRLRDQLEKVAAWRQPLSAGVTATEPKQILADLARQYLAELGPQLQQA